MVLAAPKWPAIGWKWASSKTTTRSVFFSPPSFSDTIQQTVIKPGDGVLASPFFVLPWRVELRILASHDPGGGRASGLAEIITFLLPPTPLLPLRLPSLLEFFYTKWPPEALWKCAQQFLDDHPLCNLSRTGTAQGSHHQRTRC